MKKHLKVLLVVVSLASMMLFGLFGCIKQAEAVDYAGTYVLFRAEIDGEAKEGEEINALFPPDQNYVEIVDSVNIIFMLRGERIETTYTKEGNTLHVDDGDATLDFMLVGNELSYFVADRGTTLFFTKSQ